MKTPRQTILDASVFAAFSATVELGSDGTTWVQLLPSGSFSARDGRGPYMTGSKADMEKIVAATRSYLGSTDLMIDYDHQAVFGAVPGVGGAAKAAGWVKDFEVRDDGIFGRVEWTEAAAAAISAKEYRYLSPVFKPEKSGRVVLIKLAGLTNTPALDLMAVAANSQFEEDKSMDKLALILGLGAAATDAAVIASVTELVGMSTAVAKLAGAKDGASPAEVTTALEAFSTSYKEIAKAAGAKDGAVVSDVVAAVKTSVAATTPDPAKFIPVDQFVALNTRVTELQQGISSKAAEDAVNSAIQSGKLVPALRDWGLALHKSDTAAFNSLIATAPTLTATQLQAAKKPNGTAEFDASDLSVMSAMGLSADAFKAARALEV